MWGHEEIPEACNLLTQWSEVLTTFLGWHLEALLLTSLVPAGEAHTTSSPHSTLFWAFPALLRRSYALTWRGDGYSSLWATHHNPAHAHMHSWAPPVGDLCPARGWPHPWWG